VIIAEKLLVVPSTLVVTSFEWHWLKPTSGPWLPVQNESGLISMLKKVKQKSEAYIIIHMHALTQRTVTESSSKAWDHVADDDSDLEDCLVTKKVCCIPSCLRIIGTHFLQMKLDNALEEIVAKLSNKYAPGLCDRHADLPCFHHRTSNLHFNLNCPRLLVWAQAIKAGSTTYEKVPMLSPMFKSLLALKHVSKNAKDSDTANASNTSSAAPSTSMPPVTQPSMSAQLQMPIPFGNFLQFPQPLFPHMYAQTPMPPFMGYGPSVPYAGNHFFNTGSGTGMVSMPTKASRSPPSSPPTADCTIAEFCDAYDLSRPRRG
jgi:hypothetical protein